MACKCTQYCTCTVCCAVIKLNTLCWLTHCISVCHVVQMFLSGPTLPSLFSSLLSPPSDDEFDEDSDEEDEEEESTTERLLVRGPRRRRRNRRRSGLLRHNIPWPAAEPRGFFPRYVTPPNLQRSCRFRHE